MLSLNEAFDEIGNKSMKTPIAVLQELLAKRGHQPTYKEVNMTDEGRRTSFKFIASYDDRSGKKKK